MKLLVFALVSSAVWAAPARLTFTKSFPKSTPPYTYVSVDRTGTLTYKEAPDDNQPVTAHLQESDVDTLFAMAEKLDYFHSRLESGLKVADTGKKTFRYEPDNGPAAEASFNYSVNPTAQQLLERFEDIAASERAFVSLQNTMRYDKLGVNDALADIESLWLRKQLAAPGQFVPLPTHISSHESFMHLVRARAARPKDEFQATPTASSAPKQQ